MPVTKKSTLNRQEIEKWEHRDALHAKAVVIEGADGNSATVGSNGSQDVNISDQTSPVVIAKFNQVQESTTLTNTVAIEDTTITVDDVTGIVAGRYIILFDATSVRFYTGYALNVTGSVITLDTPLDFAYPSGTIVDSAITNLAVDGSGTTEIFGLRGLGVVPGIDLRFDVVRLIFTMITTGTVTLAKFGDIVDGLTKGLVLRKRDGVFNNIFNVKSNRDLKNLMFDFDTSITTNPNQGQNGLVCRMTFGGQSKMGVVQRLALGEDLELLVQDLLNAAGTILIFEVVAEGHIVVD